MSGVEPQRPAPQCPRPGIRSSRSVVGMKAVGERSRPASAPAVPFAVHTRRPPPRRVMTGEGRVCVSPTIWLPKLDSRPIKRW